MSSSSSSSSSSLSPLDVEKIKVQSEIDDAKTDLKECKQQIKAHPEPAELLQKKEILLMERLNTLEERLNKFEDKNLFLMRQQSSLPTSSDEMMRDILRAIKKAKQSDSTSYGQTYCQYWKEHPLANAPLPLPDNLPHLSSTQKTWLRTHLDALEHNCLTEPDIQEWWAPKHPNLHVQPILMISNKNQIKVNQVDCHFSSGVVPPHKLDLAYVPLGDDRADRYNLLFFGELARGDQGDGIAVELSKCGQTMCFADHILTHHQPTRHFIYHFLCTKRKLRIFRTSIVRGHDVSVFHQEVGSIGGYQHSDEEHVGWRVLKWLASLSRAELGNQQLHLQVSAPHQAANQASFPLDHFIGSGATSNVFMVDVQLVGDASAITSAVKMFLPNFEHIQATEFAISQRVMSVAAPTYNGLQSHLAFAVAQGRVVSSSSSSSSSNQAVPRPALVIRPCVRGLVQFQINARRAIQLLLSIQHLHLTGYVHRDVRPTNVALDASDNRNLYLLDFGFAYKIPSLNDAQSLATVPFAGSKICCADRYFSWLIEDSPAPTPLPDVYDDLDGMIKTLFLLSHDKDIYDEFNSLASDKDYSGIWRKWTTLWSEHAPASSNNQWYQLRQLITADLRPVPYQQFASILNSMSF